MISILLYREIYFFQLCGYRFNKYFKYLINKGFKEKIILLLFLINIKIYKMILYPLIIIYFIYLIFKQRKKLVFTKRVIRLLIIIYLLIIILFKYYFYIIPFFYLLIIISYIINYPYEKIIYNYYKKKTIKRIKEFKGIKIVITGSYGKTSTKYYLYQTLKNRYNVFYTPNSYNTPMGISKCVLDKKYGLNNIYDVAIFEFGATKKNDIKELVDMMDYDYSIVTSVGYQHLETFKNINNIIKEKLEVSKKGICLINIDNIYLNKYKKNHKFISYSLKEKSNIYLNNNIVYFNNKELFKIEINLKGENNKLNILSCIGICLLLNLDKELIKKGIKELKPMKNRLEIKELNNKIIIDNAFNSNYEGFIDSLNILNNYQLEKWIITPGLVELGYKEKEIHNKIGLKINEVCDYILLVNKKNTKYLREVINRKYYLFKSFKQAYNYYLNNSKNSVLLIENDLPDNY